MSALIPNTTQTPNLYYDKLFALLNEGEGKTLQYAIRRTLGFHKETDRISISQFMHGNGRIGKDGKPVEIGTLLSKGNQVKSCKSLVKFGILIEVSENDKKKNEGKEWRLQLDESKIDFGALWARYEKRHKAAKKRMKNVVAAAAPCPSDGQANLQKNGSLPIPYDEQPPIPYDEQPPSREGVSMTRTHRKKVRNKDRNTDRVREENGRDEALEITWGMLKHFCEGDEDTAAAIWQLQEAFCESSGIPRPDIDTEHGRNELKNDWWPKVQALLTAANGDLEAAREGVKTAVAEMLDWKPSSVTGPWSIQKKINGVLNAQRRAQQQPEQPQNDSYQHVSQVPVSALLGQ